MGSRYSFPDSASRCGNKELNAGSYCALGDFYLRKGDRAAAEQPLRDGLARVCLRLFVATGTWESCCVQMRAGRSGSRAGFCHSALPEGGSENVRVQALLYQAQGNGAKRKGCSSLKGGEYFR